MRTGCWFRFRFNLLRLFFYRLINLGQFFFRFFLFYLFVYVWQFFLEVCWAEFNYNFIVPGRKIDLITFCIVSISRGISEVKTKT